MYAQWLANHEQSHLRQIERIVTINEPPTLTTEVVTLARERLVDGPA